MKLLCIMCRAREQLFVLQQKKISKRIRTNNDIAS